MTQIRLEQLFPELLKLTNNPLSIADFTSLPYFNRYLSMLSQKQCKTKAQKVHKYFKLLKVKKGTVIFGCDDSADNGYILLNGCIQLLKKKSIREKTQMFPGHILHHPIQRENFLHDNFNILRNKVQSLSNLFFQQKVQFRYLIFQNLLKNQQFGFGQMMRNSNYTMTAIAIQQTQLLKISKNSFDSYLRDFHTKKQNCMMMRLLSGIKEDVIQQMLPKMLQIMNQSILLKFENQDVIYDQNQFPSDLYYVVEGQIQLRKKVVFTVPKKFMKHQIIDPLQKQMIVKVCKIGKGQIFGEQQIFSSRKNRNNTVVCTLNGTLILKIDHSVFMKAIADSPDYEKMIIQNAVFKKANADESYDKQFKKISKAFMSQYQAYDSKKKQKLISNMINNNQKNIQLFQAYTPQGVFFRDTFQKLQGFDQAQKSPNKKTSIKRFKQKSNIQTPQSIKKQKINYNQNTLDRILQNQVTQKILFSPKKNINVADIYGEDLQNKINQSQVTSTPIKLQKRSNSQLFTKSIKSVSKFQEIQKDEAIYKRVLIKNGLYPIDKKIDKTKSVKALVHYNFDDVVRQCVTRKNQALKRSSKDKQDQVVVQSFHRAVQSLKNSSITASQYKFSRFTSPCIGTEQFKKRMQSIHKFGSATLTQFGHSRKKSIIAKIQDCIGVNQKPKSSQISYRNLNTQKTTYYHTPNKTSQKLVLLNHMMKPITYYKSTEF